MFALTLRKAALAACLSAAFCVPAAADPLEGLWVSTAQWDAGPSGAITVTHAKASWRASLAGLQTSFRVRDNDVRFALPGQRGSFRGAFAASKTVIKGFWIQPHAGNGDPRDPDGQGQTFASPVTLMRGKDGAWHGTVTPLQDHMTFYLKLFAAADGKLMAAFRNPEMNFRARAPQFAVTQAAGKLTFTDPTQAGNHFDATVTPDTITVTFGGIDRPFAFTRATVAQENGFYLRPRSEAPYRYRMPDDIGDGWHVARAADAGMDESKLAQLAQGIIATDPAALRPSLIHSLLIAHRGKLVLEEYFAGFTRDTPHDLRSAAKTFSSIMLGAVARQGVALSPETPLYPMLHGPFANPDPRKATITLGQLMTHTSGLACDDNDDASPGGEETMQSQRKQPDWSKYTLDLPMAHDPGTRYAYCSAGTNLVGTALTTATHEWLPALFDRTVAQPLQWGPYYWDLTPNDEGYLGGGVYARPRDLLKIGQAYLEGGMWNGRRIVDASWITQSTAVRVAVSPETTGLSGDDFSNVYIPGKDGYAWHLTDLKADGHSYATYGMSGNGGQLLVVVPELDLAVVFTGGNYGQGRIWNGWRDELLPSQIIPAITR